MTLFWFVLITVLFFALVLARLLATAVRWGREFKELEAAGVETTGVVTRKVQFSSRGGRSRYIRYEYRDQFGQTHSRKVVAIGDAWETHHEGGPIAIIYSQRTPRISAAKFLYEPMAQAAREKQARRSGSV